MSIRRSKLARTLKGEQGYATIAAVGIIAAVCALLLVVIAIAGAVVARHQAQVAADMSAVSAAGALALGQEACSVATQVARDNSAELSHCAVEGGDVLVTADVRGRQARARAGPL